MPSSFLQSDEPREAVAPTCRGYYSNGVLVHSTPYPGEPVGGEGGACFVGTEGRIAVDRSSIVSYPANILTQPLRPADVRVYHADSHSGNFLECVRTRKESIAPAEVAHRSTTLCLISDIAMRLGRKLKWDPKAERFPDDPDANQMLSRPMRKPWTLS